LPYAYVKKWGKMKKMRKKDNPKYETIVLEDGTQARHYFADNSIRNERGHMIQPLESPNPITSENARARALARVEKKRAVIAEAANKQVESMGFDNSRGDLSFIAAIAQAAIIKALNPSDTKQIDAARFLIQETGLSEKTGQNIENTSTNTDSILQNLGESVVNALITRIKQE